MSNLGDLGRPVGGGGGPTGLTGATGLTGTQQADPTEYRESGEHGQGLGVSGGVSLPSFLPPLPILLFLLASSFALFMNDADPGSTVSLTPVTLNLEVL